MAADAAPLFVSRQIVAIDRGLYGCDGGNQLRHDLARQEVFYIKKRALPGKLAAQSFEVQSCEARIDNLLGRSQTRRQPGRTCRRCHDYPAPARLIRRIRSARL